MYRNKQTTAKAGFNLNSIKNFIARVRILLTYKVPATVHLYIHKCPWAFMNI